ncbi:MAG: DUF302 domain-containing protein [Myxococcaceae bacterium]|nr:DUF302 domain-containing protein [Myxococcaceae bacterium]
MNPRSTRPHVGSGIVSKASPYSVEETVTRMEYSLGVHGLTLFARIDHGAEARRAGKVTQEAQLLLFGNPRAAAPVLVASPLAGLDLPLKALVWEDDEGQVWVSYNSVTFLTARHAIPGGLTENVSGVDALVDAVVHDEVAVALEGGMGPV